MASTKLAPGRLGSVKARLWLLGGRAANGQRINAKGRLPNPHRDALPILAAGADAGIELHVVADHGNASHGVGTVADERRSFDRCTDLAVFDLVRLGAGEDELAGGD